MIYTFSEAKQLFNNGDELFVVDLSTFMQHKESTDDYHKSGIVQEIQRKERKPLIVVNAKPYPYQWRDRTEFFIDVKFKDMDEVYRICNSTSLVYKNWFDYAAYIEDAEECACFGY
ncbi:MAG: hypothetical protein [Wendovervirus sonii]|uniref:Uncharacterized protein n=1 Tax=phage Lak_Megaphage_Sonny TaxID=3109229 RepID=A0ABZ0Z6Q1_9CAUD|nr:MAG: hypothetical protein [phage Lak_Megaphage_Sonny]